MKKLILCNKPNIAEEKIYLNEIDEKSIIGFVNSFNDKFFITNTKDYFVVIGSNNFTTSSKQRFNSFEEIFNNFNDSSKIFIFVTASELFKWLAS